MNLGIYLASLSNHDQLRESCDGLNYGIDTKLITDGSLFYDNVAYNPFILKCGIFNSTELWNFNGKLITTSLAATLTSLKIVNNIQIYFYNKWENKNNPLHLMNLLKNNILLISENKEESNEIYRKTGYNKTLVYPTIKDIVSDIGAI